MFDEFLSCACKTVAETTEGMSYGAQDLGRCLGGQP